MRGSANLHHTLVVAVLSLALAPACGEDTDCRHFATCAPEESSGGSLNVTPGQGGTAPLASGAAQAVGGAHRAGGVQAIGGSLAGGGARAGALVGPGGSGGMSASAFGSDAGSGGLPRPLAGAAGGENGTGGRQPAGCGLGGGQSTCQSPTPVCGVQGECLTCRGLDEGCEAPLAHCQSGITDRDNRCVECVADANCGSDKPYCINNQCLACTPDGQPNTACAEKLTCKPGATPPENTCVGCINNNQCSGGICKDQTCLPCDAEDHNGCSAPSPKCLAGNSPSVNSCVACLAHDDCGEACQNHSCVPCSTLDHEGCGGNTPLCKSGGTLSENSCVECLGDGDCGDGICEGNVCMPCSDSTDRGCKDGAPQCKSGGTDKQNSCVECLKKGDCKDSKKALCASNNECVGCLENKDCSSAGKAKCGEAKSCEKCSSDSDCSHIDGKNVCDSGTCVECTLAKEARACGENSCNPATRSCTDTKRGSRELCTLCVADSECEEAPNTRCVPMTFKGKPRSKGYCLRRAASGCERPYTVGFSATSLSGASEETYCGINQDGGTEPEDAVTCEAVRDLSDDASCKKDSDCGGGQGGWCRTVGLVPNKCTYACGTAASCPSDRQCDAPTTPYCH